MKFVEDKWYCGRKMIMKKASLHDKTSNRPCVLDWPHNLIRDHIMLHQSLV